MLYRKTVTERRHRSKPPFLPGPLGGWVIENRRRDLNIALMNELAIIFDRLGIPTKEVCKCCYQMEFPAGYARPARWALHRRRSLLPDARADVRRPRCALIMLWIGALPRKSRRSDSRLISLWCLGAGAF